MTNYHSSGTIQPRAPVLSEGGSIVSRSLSLTASLLLSLLLAIVISACAKPAVAKKEIPTNAKVAVFAGGCFWCMEGPFEALPGVYEVYSGYTGGNIPNPGYKAVASGLTRHREAVQIHYDPTEVSYAKLLDTYWRTFDPTDNGGQFADRGPQYKAGIFYGSPKEKQLAETSKAALGKLGIFSRPIVTEILPASTFYKAEANHQDYYRTNPGAYKRYRVGSGRDGFLRKHWAGKTNIVIIK